MVRLTGEVILSVMGSTISEVDVKTAMHADATNSSGEVKVHAFVSSLRYFFQACALLVIVGTILEVGVFVHDIMRDVLGAVYGSQNAIETGGYTSSVVLPSTLGLLGTLPLT